MLGTMQDEGLHTRLPAMYRDKSTISQLSTSDSTLQQTKSTRTEGHGHTEVKESKNTLVFLTEKGLKKDMRLMQKRGTEQIKNESKSPEWFQDRRYQHEQQAKYLQKLSNMRKELAVSNSTSTSNTARDSTTKKDTPRGSSNSLYPKVLKEGPGFVTGPEQYTKRQRLLQVERQKIIDRQQRQRQANLGRIDVRPLTDVGPKSPQDKEVTPRRPYDSARGITTNGKLTTTKYTFVKERTPRLTVKLPYLTSPSEGFIERRQNTQEFNLITDLIQIEEKKQVRSSSNEDRSLPGQYTSSIPNIGRKAIRDPGKLFLQDTKGKGFYRNDKHGLYKGARKNKSKWQKQFLRADADEIDLNSFSQDEKYWEFYRDNTYEHSIAPCTTPVVQSQWPNEIHPEMDSSPQQINNDPERNDLISQFQRHRTHTQDLIDLDRKGNPDRSNSVSSNNNNYNMSNEKSCVRCIFCENPELIPFAGSPAEFVSQKNQIEHAKLRKAKQYNSKLNNSNKKTIFVDLTKVNEVPLLKVESPSPNKRSDFDAFSSSGGGHDSGQLQKQQTGSNGQLIKTYRQNELRQREVSNLLEDVHEINEFNKTLQDELEGE